jgi:hypothetical protein
MLAGWEWFFLGLMLWFDWPFPSVVVCFGLAIALLTGGVALEIRRREHEAMHLPESNPKSLKQLGTKKRLASRAFLA